MSKLGDLPISVAQRLCRYLNFEGDGVRNWRDLVAMAPGGYDALSCDAFSRHGMRPYTSAADQVLGDFISQGITMDQLYDMLGEMDAQACMTLLEPYVSPALLERWRRRYSDHGNYQPQPDHPIFLQGSGGVDATALPDEHPLYGPLPSLPTPLPSSTPIQYQHDNQYYDSRTILQRSGGEMRLPISHGSPPPYSNGDQFPEYSSPPRSLPPNYRGNSQMPMHNTNEQESRAGALSVPPKVSVDRGSVSNILHFSYAELSEASGGFTEGMVGIGSFGTVFKAHVRGNGPYAVKKLHSESEMGEYCVLYDSFHRETFMQELQMLTRYHHRNILSLVAYSNDGFLPCLVYEYMEHGSLAESLLQGNSGRCLLWEKRLHIAIQVANALHFLHTVNAPTALVHGDVKSANILLDVNFVPKLSDFGLARELARPGGRSGTLSTSSAVVRGTLAYMAPEFVRNRKMTTRTDVYAYGVVLLELHTGLPAFSEDQSVQEKVLTDRLYQLLDHSEDQSEEVISVADARACWPREIALGLFDIISVCVQSKRSLRPSIREVLDQLIILPPK